MSYDHRKCEDDQDATRITENILRNLGYLNVQKGECRYSVRENIPLVDLKNIAVSAERIARWARKEAKINYPW